MKEVEVTGEEVGDDNDGPTATAAAATNCCAASWVDIPCQRDVTPQFTSAPTSVRAAIVHRRPDPTTTSGRNAESRE